MAKKRKIEVLMIYLLLSLLLLVTAIISGRGSSSALADTSSYTGALTDLQNDSSFSAASYPENPDDYSIKVIQVAEGERGELFLYTYQPCQRTHPLEATDINMSFGETADGTRLYGLTLLNVSGVFAKYLVNGVKVSTAATRYYNVTSIYRVWDKSIDGETGNNNEGEKKAFSVHNIYKVTTEGGEKKYSCEPTYVVNIINPYVDFLLYTEVSSLPMISSIRYSFEQLGFIDAHYIAFSTDISIDRLKSATVTYTSRSAAGEVDKFLWFPVNSDTTYGNEQIEYAYPTYEDKVKYTGSYWTNGREYDYSWDRIQTVSEFIATEPKLTDETKSNLMGKAWVLRFAETKRTQKEKNILGYKKYEVTWTEVIKVSVLRLEFETDGKTYNLGTVCDMVSDDGHAGNVLPKDEDKNFFENIANFFKNLWAKIKSVSWWQWALIGVGALFAIGLIIAILIFGVKLVFKGIWWFIKQILKGIWWLVSLPFRGLKALINNRKKKRDNDT